jgi:hypothetical protein
MPLGLVTPFDGLIASLVVGIAAEVAWGAIRGLTAGPTRFRLALASLLEPSIREQRRAVGVHGLFSFVCLFGLLKTNSSSPRLFLAFLLIFFLRMLVDTLLKAGSRRDAKPRRVLTSGLLSLVIGAVGLALALWALLDDWQPASYLAGAFCISAILLVQGAAGLQEYRSGTRVRERGIHIFGTFRPWSHVVVEEWYPRQGGFDLILTIRGWMIAFPSQRELIVPVHDSDRPALEAFLAAHAATAA